ncbi:hypothetical protein ACTVH1_17810 [Gluconobacter cerinus]
MSSSLSSSTCPKEAGARFFSTGTAALSGLLFPSERTSLFLLSEVLLAVLFRGDGFVDFSGEVRPDDPNSFLTKLPQDMNTSSGPHVVPGPALPHHNLIHD